MRRFILTILTFILSSIPVFIRGEYQSNALAIIQLCIMALCSFHIYSKPQYPFSLYKLVYIFILLFFSVAPVIQFKNGVRFLGTYFSEGDYVMTSIYVFLIVLIYNICYEFFLSRIKVTSHRYKLPKVTDVKEVLIVITSFVILLYFLYINNFNLMNFVYRSGVEDRETSSQILGLLSSTLFRGLSMCLFALVISVRGFHKITRVIVFFSFILTNFPTGMARYMVAVIYLPLALYIFPSLRRKDAFSVLIIFSLLVIFPFFNTFRYYSPDTLNSFKLNFDQFTDLHFDAFSMFMRVVTEDIVTWGRQLIGVFFFMVPRAFWPNKPIGSGAYVADSIGSQFRNVSMPYFAEGYINFGFLGILLFVIVLSYLTAYYDKTFWHTSDKSGYNVFSYYILLGIILFIMRGDLMSSFAYLCGFYAAFYLVKKIAY